MHNASSLTRHAAKGLALCAAYLDTDGKMSRPEAVAWVEWRNANSPVLVAIVENAQRDLFDVINAKQHTF